MGGLRLAFGALFIYFFGCNLIGNWLEIGWKFVGNGLEMDCPLLSSSTFNLVTNWLAKSIGKVQLAGNQLSIAV